MVHIRRIREKIEIDPKNPKYLKVVWGIGYKMEKWINSGLIAAVIIAMVGGVLFGIYQMHTMDNYNDGLDFTTIKKVSGWKTPITMCTPSRGF